MLVSGSTGLRAAGSLDETKTQIAGRMPRLARDMKVDGNLQEWASIPSVPVRSMNCASRWDRAHVWKGPADASAEFFCAWSEKGLYMAARVADDDLRRSAKKEDTWTRDCVQFFIDARSADLLATPGTVGTELLQFVIRPPAPNTPVEIDSGTMDLPGVRVAGKKTKMGYDIEVFMPWTAAPSFRAGPGREIGVAFALNEYDARDGKLLGPLQLTFAGRRSLNSVPTNLIRWKLVESLTTGADALVGPFAAVEAKRGTIEFEPLPVRVEIGSVLGQRARSVRLNVLRADGKRSGSATMKLKPASAPWTGGMVGVGNLTADQSREGWQRLVADIYDAKGRPIGKAYGRFFSMGLPIRNALSRMKQTNISKLSQTEPFKAAGYMGAASCLEMAKRCVAAGEWDMSEARIREINARLDALEGKLNAPSKEMHDLLTLTMNPDAQVVVEYPAVADLAIVGFYYGGMPLANASVRQYADENAAQKALVTEYPDWIWVAPREHTTTDQGLQAICSPTSCRWDDSEQVTDMADDDVLVMSKGRNNVVIINVRDIPCALVDAAVIVPGCPKSLRTKVEKWAEQNKIPIVDVGDPLAKNRVLVAGDISKSPFAEKKAPYCARIRTVDSFGELKAVSGNRVISVCYPSRQAAEMVVKLIADCKPVAVKDVETIRMEALKVIDDGTQPKVNPAGNKLYFGDMHMHTIYSDGNPTPVGLALQTMYCYMDYAAITDHGTTEGARLAQKLFQRNGFEYPLIVGEEITTEQWHMNAYPLTKTISQELPAYETIREAHAQGATIHWNHPWMTDWAKPYLTYGIAETGMDAWEHLPQKYETWRVEKGMLPAVVGTSDTHNCIFGDSERSTIFAPSPEGQDVAEAVRAGRVVAVAPYGPYPIFGGDDMIYRVREALALGDTLKQSKAEQLRKALKNADVVGLLKASPPQVTK